MSLISKVVLPYSEALLESAQKASIVEEINQDVSIISNALKESEDLTIFLENPLVSLKIKKDVLKEIFEKQISNTILKFLLILVDRRRISLLSLIIEKYLELAYKLDSIMIANVFTPISLSPSQHDELISKLKSITKTNQIQLSIEIDSSLIGGLKIQIGSKVIDTSILGKLNQIAYYLKAA